MFLATATMFSYVSLFSNDKSLNFETFKAVNIEIALEYLMFYLVRTICQVFQKTLL